MKTGANWDDNFVFCRALGAKWCFLGWFTKTDVLNWFYQQLCSQIVTPC